MAGFHVLFIFFELAGIPQHCTKNLIMLQPHSKPPISSRISHSSPLRRVRSLNSILKAFQLEQVSLPHFQHREELDLSS
ncbi:hypothetical protein V8E51_009388 [Hyaloscypha variabilis]